MKLRFSHAAGTLLAITAAGTCFGQTNPPSATSATISAPAAPQAQAAFAGGTALATHGDAKITVADYEASIRRIPERDRFGFQMAQARINSEINTLLQIRSVANEARKHGFDKDPSFKLRVEHYAERLLTEMLNARIDEEAGREFEQKKDGFIGRAREQYLVNKSQFQAPKEVKASHILVEMKTRTADDALAKVKALRVRAIAGESFETLAETSSDDPTARSNKGSLGFFGPGRMDPAFEAAAYALKNPMDISEPVKSQFGYHIIRLEEIKPPRQLTFEEAQGELMEKLRAQYVDQRRQQILAGIYDPSKVNWNEAAVISLKKTVDSSVFRAVEKR